MRAFMEGIGQDIVDEKRIPPAHPRCAGCAWLSTDLFEFEELGRKLLLSIDRNVLVDLPLTSSTMSTNSKQMSIL